MKVLGDNQYQCESNERITFSFSTPHRDNLEIRKRINKGSFSTVDGDSNEETIGASERTVTFSFRFGADTSETCDITISGSAGGEDSDVASDIGIPDRKVYTFLP